MAAATSAQTATTAQDGTGAEIGIYVPWAQTQLIKTEAVRIDNLEQEEFHTQDIQAERPGMEPDLAPSSDHHDDADMMVIPYDIAAAETVVTTTNMSLHDSEITMISSQSETGNDAVCPSLLFDEVGNMISGPESSESDSNKLISQTELSALHACLSSCSESQKCAAESLLQNGPYDTQTTSESTIITLEELKKRERARLLKRKLRKNNPSFREKEKEQARERMRNKRNDPEYREQERRKDRERRKNVRLVNEEARQKERERDKVQKRLSRENMKELRQLHNHETLVSVADALYVENCFVISDSSDQSYWTTEHVIGQNTDSIIQSDSRTDEEDGGTSLLTLDFGDKVNSDGL